MPTCCGVPRSSTVLAAAAVGALAGVSGMRHLRKLTSAGSFRVIRLGGREYTDAAQSRRTASTPTSCCWTGASTPSCTDVALS